MKFFNETSKYAYLLNKSLIWQYKLKKTLSKNRISHDQDISSIQ